MHAQAADGIMSRLRVGRPATSDPAATIREEAGVGVRVYAGAALLALSAVAVGGAQAKVSTPEELNKVMKKVGPAMQATQKALQSNAVAEMKSQIAIAKQGVLDSQSFWI